MIKIKIISVGKTKESWLDEALQEYIKRLKAHIFLEFCWVKNDEQLMTSIEKEESVICLDPNGSMMDSEEFSKFLFKELEEAGSRLSLIIGGPEGLPKKLKESHQLISLSKMTFTHQITRLILAEQIYRAFEITRGSPYHK